MVEITTPSLIKIPVPDEGIETLFGSHDENLRQLEREFDVRIRTDGHRAAGQRRRGRPGADGAGRGSTGGHHPRGIPAVGRRRAAGGAAGGGRCRRRPARLSDARAGAALQPPAGAAEEREPAPLPGRHRALRPRARRRAGGHRQDVPGDGPGGGVPDGQAGEPHHPRPPGGGGRREARISPRRPPAEGQSVPAPVVRRAVRHARRRAHQPAAGVAA